MAYEATAAGIGVDYAQSGENLREFIPRSEYCALRDDLELAIGVAISKVQIAKGKYVPNDDVKRMMREKYGL